MNKLFCIISVIIFISCGQQDAQGNNTGMETVETNNVDDVAPPGTGDTLFTITDAEKVLGEAGRFTESSTTVSAKSTMYSSAYAANGKDATTGKTGNVYYLSEKFAEDSVAHNDYMHIKTMNEKNGIRELNGLGDEAYFHTDNQNFYFIMVRKGNKSFRIKVNKITTHTTEQAFMDVAKHITAQL